MILHCLVMQVKLGWLLGICMSGVRFNNEQSSKNCVSMSWVGLNKRPQYGMYVATVLSVEYLRYVLARVSASYLANQIF